jgi:PHD/YefM family antitoxin component YafN of YafNO toxin-antitoxin module
MKFVDLLLQNKLDEAKQEIFTRLNSIVAKRLDEAKRYVAADSFETIEETLDEALRRNPNIIKIGRIQKIRRRIRRNAKGRIVVQKNIRRSGIKGYRISGNTIKRIPAATRIKKARLLKRSWKTTRKAKLRRTLMKRKMSMRRRASIGLK